MKNKSAENTTRLVLECRRANKTAQYQLFNKYYDAMYAVCNRIIQNDHDAEEVLQDAFIAAFSKIKKLKSPRAFGAWLKQIVISKSISFIRRKSKIQWKELPDNISVSISDDSPIYDLDREQIDREIHQLPEGCRIIFLLYLIESYKHEDIADMLNISVSTSKSQYQRAKSLLKERLTKLIDER